MATKAEEKAAADKMSAARNKNLDLAIQQIAKDYGEGAIMRLGGERTVDIDVIPTGNILIDRALGVGGFPRGRVVEVCGPESSGKPTLALTVIAQAHVDDFKSADLLHFYKPDPRKNRRDVWKPGDHSWRKGFKVLRQYAGRYPPNRGNYADRRRRHG